MITLVLGGARSGKSRIAQELAGASSLPVVYIATATALDEEMATRIEHHQHNRPSEWRLLECPLDLAAALQEETQQPQTILVDCLTLWLNNQLFEYPEQDFSALFDALVNSLNANNANVIFVANEVGLGIIPLGEVSRKFVDEAGRLNQQLARISDKVLFVAAGLPLSLKDNTK